jgi:hypothetical protein
MVVKWEGSMEVRVTPKKKPSKKKHQKVRRPK